MSKGKFNVQVLISSAINSGFAYLYHLIQTIKQNKTNIDILFICNGGYQLNGNRKAINFPIGFKNLKQQNKSKPSTASPNLYSLRKHPFLLALRRWGRFARRNETSLAASQILVPDREINGFSASGESARRARRNGCFRRLKFEYTSTSSVLIYR